MPKRAVLIANLGSPDYPDIPSVRRYLDQFLMDRHVIQLPWVFRRLIVSLLVLPTRPKASAQAYQSIWTDEGSPLIVLSKKLQQAMQAKLTIPVALAMRYGQPSIESTIQALSEQGIEEIIYLPLYPHYADSTVATSIEAAEHAIKKQPKDITLKVIKPFYQHSDYIEALYQQTCSYLESPYDHLIFSYHGLPESHITRHGGKSAHKLEGNTCCDVEDPIHHLCYRHQVLATTQAFAHRAALDSENYSVAFQSRLGRQKWLGPNTEDRLVELAQTGVKNVLVMCPAFVTDCLETLEEIAIRGEEVFIAAGGESLTLIPCLNDHPAWVETLVNWTTSRLNTTD